MVWVFTDKMPKACTDCHFYYDYLRCMVTEKSYCSCDDKPDWCPLKPLPKSRVMLDYRELMDKLDEHEYPEYWDVAIEETEKIEAIPLKDILGGKDGKD